MTSKITFVPTRAVNRLMAMPRQRVTANPLIGPVPKRNSARPVISVVTCESIIVSSALS